MSAYAAIDPILTAWARRKGLHVYTHYKDDEIRSVAIYGPDDAKGVYISVLSTSTGWSGYMLALVVGSGLIDWCR